MSLSTTNILIVSLSFPYRFLIVSLSFPYRFLIVSVSFSYRSPIVLLLFSYWGSGNNTETIRNRTKDERRMNEERYYRNCWADCDAVSLLMIFQELIKFDFGTFFLDDDLYNTLQNLRHIKILLPKTEQKSYMKTLINHPSIQNCINLFYIICTYSHFPVLFYPKIEKRLAKSCTILHVSLFLQRWSQRKALA